MNVFEYHNAQSSDFQSDVNSTNPVHVDLACLFKQKCTEVTKLEV